MAFHFRSLPVLLAALACLSLPACSTIYYEGMEKLGVEKRDILVSRVGKARDAQQDTKEQFESALDEFSTLVNFKGGDLEKTYNRLNAEFQRSEAKANAVGERNNEVERVSKALFREWEAELKQYSNASLRSSSAQQLEETRRRYTELMRAMRRAEDSIDPVLKTFRDHVLYLKHNLNARAIGSLKSELRSVENDTAALIREMNASIAEADRFIRSMK